MTVSSTNFLNKQILHNLINLYVYIIIILFDLQLCDSKQICKSEYSSIFNEKTLVKWEAKSNLNNQVVISEPSCFDNSNTLITRVCYNGSWHPTHAPVCQFVSYSTTKRCPDHLNYVGDKCMFVSQPRIWQDGCPLPIHYKNLFKVEVENDLWLPLKRLVRFGPFEYTIFGEDYGKSASVDKLNISDYQDFFKNDCLLYRGKDRNVKVENCSNLHERICAFYPNYQFYACPKHCKSTGLDGKKCYCESNKPCQNYAVIHSSFDKHVLEEISNGKLCRIGAAHSFSLPLSEMYSYLNGSDWIYGNFSTNCYICEEASKDNKSGHIVLSFDKKTRELYLLVYDTEVILKYDDDYAIYCFTDASKKLKKKVKIRQIFKYNKNYSLHVYQLKLEKYIGQYWCEAFNRNTSMIKSNKIIAYKNRKGNEYSLRLLLNNVCKYYDCDNFFSTTYEHFIDENLKDVLSCFKPQIRAMEIINYSIKEDYLDILFHVSTEQRRNLVSEYYDILVKLTRIPQYITIVYFRSSEFCLPETINWGGTFLKWPITRLGQSITSEELCVSQARIPAIRICQGDFLYGAKWSEIKGNCSKNAIISEDTVFLRNASVNPTLNIQHITKIVDNEKMSVLDIYYLTKILSSFTNKNVDYLFKIINQVLRNDVKILKESQELLNSTDDILNLIEEINFSFQPESLYLLQTENLIIHVTKPFLNNISGLLIYGKRNDTFSNFTIKHFTRNNTINSLKTEITNLQLAVYVPEQVLDQISENSTDLVQIITVIFRNDILFMDSQYRSVSSVVSVTIPGFGSYLKSPLSVFFRSNSDAKKCAFWDNGKSSNRKRGYWSTLGGNFDGKLDNTSIYMCSFLHLSHFALLVMSERPNIADKNEALFGNSNENDFLLNLITIIGGFLSFLGIIGIFLTALISVKWRSKIGTKILLNLSIAILVETFSIHLSEIESIKHSDQSCKFVGMFLHYIVLSKFFWMLIYAVLQYLRFVTVIGTIPKNLILKSVIVGWVLPLVPVLLVGLITDKTSYNSELYEICYPRGIFLYLSVLLPIIVIVCANFIIFCIIMYHVTRTTTASCGKNNSYKLQLYLAVLLFFVLGLPWVFGILAELMTTLWLKIILFYIFCITGTLQGFVLFLFYVIINKETRTYWIKYIRRKNFL